MQLSFCCPLWAFAELFAMVESCEEVTEVNLLIEELTKGGIRLMK